MSLLRFLVFSFVLILLFACAEKKPLIVKEFYVEDLQDFLNKMKIYSSIEGILNLQYEGKNNLQGDAFLRISERELLLRVYYMGFPAGEVYEENGEVTSNLLIEKDRLKQLVTGIRKGFIWWDGDFVVEENSNEYILKDKKADRIVILKKSGFMPLIQTLNVEGQTLLINYDDYSKIQTEDGTVLNMPMNIVVYYKNRTLKIKIERIKIKNA
ncbi:MAG: hypothetical protein N3A00_03490 [Thermodesulfovibrio sp.]|nr:hypothetical protein [Thermodesulfovibrio sp.]